jgi:hypothetical protein
MKHGVLDLCLPLRSRHPIAYRKTGELAAARSNRIAPSAAKFLEMSAKHIGHGVGMGFDLRGSP